MEEFGWEKIFFDKMYFFLFGLIRAYGELIYVGSLKLCNLNIGAAVV